MNNFKINEKSKNIRALALQTLKGKWRIAVGASALSILLVIGPTLIIQELMAGSTNFEIFLINIENIIIGAPITFGLILFMISLFRNNEMGIGQIFSGFEYFVKVVSLRIVISIFVMLWTFCFIIPGLIASIRYSQAFYILAEDPSKGIMQCIEESKWMMRGNKWKFFCLTMSFFGWALLATIPAGIGYIWLIPYFLMTQVAFYELVSGNLRQEMVEENRYEQ
jgi:uncharacterized membrane protein